MRFSPPAAPRTLPFAMGDVNALAQRMGDALLTIRREAGIDGDHAAPEGFVEIKADHSTVTLADKAAHRLALEGLKAIHDVPILSEEGTKAEKDRALQAPAFWVVDPLDGTSLFLNGSKDFAVLLAYVEQGKAVAGAVYFPAKDELYFTGDNGQTYRRTKGEPPQPLRRTEPPKSGAFTVARLSRRPDFPLPSAGQRDVRFVEGEGPMRHIRVMTGEIDAAICGLDAKGEGCGKYDCAAFDALGRGMGLSLRDGKGRELDYAQRYDPSHPDKAPSYIFAAPETLRALGLNASRQR